MTAGNWDYAILHPDGSYGDTNATGDPLSYDEAVEVFNENHLNGIDCQVIAVFDIPKPQPRKMHLAVCIEWTEIEVGWGHRPDGYSFHTSIDDAKAYLEYENERSRNVCSTEFSEGGNPQVCEISEDIYNKIKTKDELTFYRMFNHEKHKLPKGSIKFV